MPLQNNTTDTILAPTGFEIIDLGQRRIRRASGVRAQVNDPTTRFVAGKSSRAARIDTKSPVDLALLETAYQADTLLRQAVDKFVEMIVKAGGYLSGNNSDAVDYVETRLSLLEVTRKRDQRPLDLFIKDICEDYVKYGNAFLRIQRTQTQDPFPGIKAIGLKGKSPIGGYFSMNPISLEPEIDEKGFPTKWIQKYPGQDKVSHNYEDVIHLYYKRTTGTLWGVSMFAAVVEDLRLLRQCEEMVSRLIYKYLNPLLHQEVPDIVGDGQGTQEDVDEAQVRYQEMPPDGFIITPPGHKITMVGAQGAALDASSYLEYFKKRVYSGLGVNELIMGDSPSIAAGSADVMSSQMHHRVKDFQQDIGSYITLFIINELLLEGGFNPILNPDDKVEWTWGEIELDAQVKMENHAADLYTKNAITFSELRKQLKRKPLTADEEKDLYLYRVQIPLAENKASQTSDSVGRSAQPDMNKDQPANQHGKRKSPKVSSSISPLVKAALNNYSKLAHTISNEPNSKEYWPHFISYYSNMIELTTNQSKRLELFSLFERIHRSLINTRGLTPSKIYGQFESLRSQLERIFT